MRLSWSCALATGRNDMQGLNMMTALFLPNALRRRLVHVVILLAGFPVFPLSADEAPTILIEDVILNCVVEESALAMPASKTVPIDTRVYERLFHSKIARTCQGENVCRIEASSLIDADIERSGCDDLVIVPVCAIGAEESITPYMSTEMSLDLRAGRQLVINCNGKPNPHF